MNDGRSQQSLNQKSDSISLLNVILKVTRGSNEFEKWSFISTQQLCYLTDNYLYCRTQSEQVCIPVGCVPPASVATVNRMTDR